MTFPKKEQMCNKQNLESELVDLFKKTDTWAEFCIKAEMQYGTDVSRFFGKWHIGYVALNVGRPFVIVPMVLLSMVLVVVVVFFMCSLMLSNPMLIVLTGGALFGVVFAKAFEFNEFCDQLEGIQPYV